MEEQQANTIVLLTKEDILCQRGFPKKYYQSSFRTYKGHNVEKEKVATAIKKNTSIFFYGHCGVGKTHLAVAAAGYWAYLKKPTTTNQYPMFVSAVEFYREIRDSFDSGRREKEIIDKYSLPPLLIFDDLGKENISSWTIQELFVLVDTRYREEKPMIITSNLSLNEISSVISDSIASRIAEMGLVIELEGDDFRLKKDVKQTLPSLK